MLHGAQFIVSEKVIEHDGFSAIQMKDGRYLSFTANLILTMM